MQIVCACACACARIGMDLIRIEAVNGLRDLMVCDCPGLMCGRLLGSFGSNVNKQFRRELQQRSSVHPFCLWLPAFFFC